jgi:PAS domain S-box-containing protein
MFGYVKIMWPVIAGICMYAGVMHLQIGLRRPIDRIHTLFGLLALCVALGVFGNIWVATAQTPATFLQGIWYSSVTATLVYAVLPWFVTCYANSPHHRFAAALSALFTLILIVNFFLPYSMSLSGPPEIQQVTLPWGETLTRTTTPGTWLLDILYVGFALTVLYLVCTCVAVFKRGPRIRAWSLILSIAPFAASLTINILIKLGVLINIPYVAAPGFLAMVVIMSVALTREWRRSHEQMQTVLNSVPAVVYLKKLDGSYLFVNRQFEQLHRLQASSVLGKTDAQLFDAARAMACSKSAAQALTTGLIEFEETIDRDGAKRTYSTHLFALRDSDGSTHALCGIATDITERQAATDALRDVAAVLEHRVARRTAELAQLNRELEAFAYSVSHDLRAPLTAVNGFAELLLREQGPKLDQTANRYLNRIRDGSVRMAGLIQDLLGLSRVTQQSLERRPIDLLPTIEAAVKTLREAEPARSVTFVAPATLHAHGDPKLLSLALSNLLANAWKYTSKSPAPRVEVGSLQQEGETVYYVKDNGAGFNPEYADRLFRPFVRLHAESEFPGTGIGLATVARIINRHGGRVWAEGKVDAGATFFFTLPISDDDNVTTPQRAEA